MMTCQQNPDSLTRGAGRVKWPPVDHLPAAQAVVNAAVNVTGYDKETQLLKDRLVAALEALVDQVAPEDYNCAVDDRGWVYGAKYRNTQIRWQILAIAADLSGTAPVVNKTTTE